MELSGLIDAANEALNTKPFEPVREARLDDRFSDLVWFALPSDVDKAQIPIDCTSRIICPKICMSQEKDVKGTVAGIEPATKRQKMKFQTPKKLRALVTSALADFSMIKEGDRVLIGIFEYQVPLPFVSNR